MAENLWISDRADDKVYKCFGFSDTILDSFSSPSDFFGYKGLTSDGTNVYLSDRSEEVIFKLSGFSATVLDSFSSPSTSPFGLTWDGTDLYSTDSDDLLIYKHSGFSTTIQDSFSSPEDFPTGLTHTGDDLISVDGNVAKIYKHSGFSNVILDSFSSPSDFPHGVSYDGTNYYSSDQDSAEVYKHLGFTTTITDSFFSPGFWPNDIEWESTARFVLPAGYIKVHPSALIITATNPIATTSKNIQKPGVLNIKVNPMRQVELSSFARQIISVNPLLFISDTNPPRITKVDVTQPLGPLWDTQVLIGFTDATGLAYSTSNGYVYISCANGLIAKVNLTNIYDYSILNISDTNELLTIASSTSGQIYTSTDSATAEYYLIDERTSTTLNTNFQVLLELTDTIDTEFYTLEGTRLNTDFRVLALTTTQLNTNFQVLPAAYTAISPMGREDWHIYIDDVQLANDDLDLRSIEITHTIDEQSQATFQLARRHDQINTTFDGATVTITGQNDVKIYIGTNLEFHGKVSDLEMSYEKSLESVTVTAYENTPNDNDNLTRIEYNGALLPLPGLAENRHLYHVIVQNPRIFNPYIDPTSKNPKKYKGIKVPAGKRITERISRFQSFGDTSDLADDISDGSFKPKQNFTYFWFCNVSRVNLDVSLSSTSTLTSTSSKQSGSTGGIYNTVGAELSAFITQQQVLFHNLAVSNQTLLHSAGLTTADVSNLGLTNLNTIILQYVGTSLAGLSSQAWSLNNASYYYQREYIALEYKLGTGTITIAELEEAVPSYGSQIYSALLSYAYIDGSGNILEKFKTQTFDEFSIGLGEGISKTAYETLENTLGFFQGTAPYKEVSTRNGEFITKEKWVDRGDGLYRDMEDAYNFTAYAQKVAELEYDKIKNINGDILPITSCDMSLTLEGYYYYRIKLLSRINIDNTTETNIYKGNNGFPTSVKSITLSSDSMTVELNTDNQKSSVELATIDGEYPLENSDLYNNAGYSIRSFYKYDLQTGNRTE